MCFDLDSAPPIPPIRARPSRTTTSCSRRATETTSPLPCDARRADRRRRRHPPGRARPLPLLRGARAALRRARVRRTRVRLLRAHGRGGEARRRLRLHATRRMRRRPRRPGGPAAAVAYLRSSEGSSASSVFTVGFCFGGRTRGSRRPAGRSRGRGRFYGRPGPARTAHLARPSAQASCRADPRPYGRRGPGIPVEDANALTGARRPPASSTSS